MRLNDDGRPSRRWTSRPASARSSAAASARSGSRSSTRDRVDGLHRRTTVVRDLGATAPCRTPASASGSSARSSTRRIENIRDVIPFPARRARPILIMAEWCSQRSARTSRRRRGSVPTGGPPDRMPRARADSCRRVRYLAVGTPRSLGLVVDGTRAATRPRCRCSPTARVQPPTSGAPVRGGCARARRWRRVTTIRGGDRVRHRVRPRTHDARSAQLRRGTATCSCGESPRSSRGSRRSPTRRQPRGARAGLVDAASSTSHGVRDRRCADRARRVAT